MLTPENDKLRLAAAERSAVGDFLEWLNEQGILLTEMVEGYNFPQPIRETQDSLTMRFLGIDTVKLEEERRVLLQALRDGTL